MSSRKTTNSRIPNTMNFTVATMRRITRILSTRASGLPGPLPLPYTLAPRGTREDCIEYLFQFERVLSGFAWYRDGARSPCSLPSRYIALNSDPEVHRADDSRRDRPSRYTREVPRGAHRLLTSPSRALELPQSALLHR